MLQCNLCEKENKILSQTLFNNNNKAAGNKRLGYPHEVFSELGKSSSTRSSCIVGPNCENKDKLLLCCGSTERKIVSGYSFAGRRKLLSFILYHTTSNRMTMMIIIIIIIVVLIFIGCNSCNSGQERSIIATNEGLELNGALGHQGRFMLAWHGNEKGTLSLVSHDHEGNLYVRPSNFWFRKDDIKLHTQIYISVVTHTHTDRQTVPVIAQDA
jgi:hypothetical protein